MDPVGEVDVGPSGWAEEDLGAIGEADVGVTGGVVAVIALGLDDRAAGAGEEEPAADEVVGDGVDRAVEEIAFEALTGEAGREAQERSSATRARTAARVSRALCSCAANGTEPVPPAIRFDSSQLERCSTS